MPADETHAEEDVASDRKESIGKSKKKHSHRKSSTKDEEKIIKSGERGGDDEERRRISSNNGEARRHSHEKDSLGGDKHRSIISPQQDDQTKSMEEEDDDVHKKVPLGNEQQSHKEKVNEEEEEEVVQITEGRNTAEEEEEQTVEKETAEEEEVGLPGSGGEFLRDKVTFDWQSLEDPLGLGTKKDEETRSEREEKGTTTINVNDDKDIKNLFGIVKPTVTEKPLSKVDFKQLREEEELKLQQQKELLEDDAFTGQRSWRRGREWIVHCKKKSRKSNDDDRTIFAVVTLSPQESLDDFSHNEIPVNANISELDQPWGLLGSVRALRGSAVPSMSAVPSRFTTTQSTVTSRYSHVRVSSDLSFTESGYTQEEHNFDLADEPIWQRGRHFDFDHPTDPNKKHFITIINTLNYDRKVMEATQSTVLQEVKDRYRRYNANIDNYRWKDVYEKPLHFHLTLHENGLVDNSYITDEIGLDYYPLILLFFDDGFENDPPMQLDIRKAFIRDADILCRNYALGLIIDSDDNNNKQKKNSMKIEQEDIHTY